MLSKQYIAGLLDGEGSFLIHKTTRERKNAVNTTYTARIQLNITYKKITELMKEQYDGNFYEFKKANPKHRNTFMWIVTSKQAKKLLNDIYPYLVIKKKEAKLLLDLQKQIENTSDWRNGKHGKRRHSKETIAQREKLFQQLLQLRRI